jgi:cell division protein FtsQ
MNKLKAILKILLALLIMALIVISIVKMQNRKCSDIQVYINYDEKYPSVDSQQIISLLEKEKIPIIGFELKEIPLEKISETLEKNNFIKKVESIEFNGTTLVITVQLKTLLLHIYPEKGEQFFMDEDGFLLSFSPLIKERVMVANGAIREQFTSGVSMTEKETGQLKTLYEIALAIRKNPFCRAQFCQIYIHSDQNIELIPVIGQHIVKFGKGDRIEEKLLNIENTYTHALAYRGMDLYKELDLRFQNRVIAKKR